jgi:hypothetical protein
MFYFEKSHFFFLLGIILISPFSGQICRKKPEKAKYSQKMLDDFQNAKFAQIWLRKTPSGNAG